MKTIFICLSLLLAARGEIHKMEINTSAQSIAKNISQTLNHLLDGYDKTLRPNFGDHPTTVKIDINIRSMGPISEQNMLYSFDCYFRQTWRDSRLRFSDRYHGMKTLQLNDNMLRRIWKPDTYIYNGKGSYLHNITSPNVLFRINGSGHILYSMRLTIKASCPMHLQKFPMDRQACPLIIGSHGYDLNDVMYRWKNDDSGGTKSSIEIDKDLALSQFDLVEHPHSYRNMSIGNRGEFSMLVVHFYLERNMGYFLIQLYIPCGLLVVLSWVGFWINREATSDRIALGITTVLTMTFLGMDNRGDLPRVSYSTALDWYVAMCFAFILATVLEFAGVHYFTKHWSGELHLILDSDDEIFLQDEQSRSMLSDRPSSSRRNGSVGMVSDSDCNISKVNEFRSKKPQVTRVYADSFCVRFTNCLKGSTKYKAFKASQSVRKFNSVSQIDRTSRIGFPLAFSTFNIIYWTFFLKF